MKKKFKKVLTEKVVRDIFILTRWQQAAGTKFFERHISEGKKRQERGAGWKSLVHRVALTHTYKTSQRGEIPGWSS